MCRNPAPNFRNEVDAGQRALSGELVLVAQKCLCEMREGGAWTGSSLGLFAYTVDQRNQILNQDLQKTCVFPASSRPAMCDLQVSFPYQCAVRSEGLEEGTLQPLLCVPGFLNTFTPSPGESRCRCGIK